MAVNPKLSELQQNEILSQNVLLYESACIAVYSELVYGNSLVASKVNMLSYNECYTIRLVASKVNMLLCYLIMSATITSTQAMTGYWL